MFTSPGYKHEELVDLRSDAGGGGVRLGPALQSLRQLQRRLHHPEREDPARLLQVRDGQRPLH